MTVLGAAANGAEALRLSAELRPDDDQRLRRVLIAASLTDNALMTCDGVRAASPRQER
jgi:hypothetical protein